MNYVEMDEVVALARTMIGTSDNADEPVFRQWVWEAMQDLGRSEDEIEVCMLKPKNFMAKKPDNCRNLIDLALYDANGNQFLHKYYPGKKRIYPQVPSFAVVTDAISGETTTTNRPMVVDVSEDRHNIILGSNGSEVAYMFIRYWSYPVDSKGQPMIREDEKMAIVYFIRYAWSLRKNDNRSEIDQNANQWYRESDRCRARKKNISNEAMKTIVRDWMQLINKTNFESF